MNLPVVYFDGQAVDLEDNTVVATTFQAFKIGDLKTRSVSYTNRLKLPLTFNNQQIYENAHLVRSTTLKPYRSGVVKIVQEGIEILSNAYGQLKQVDSKYFYLEVYDGALQFFDTIKGRYVDDLDLGVYGPFDETFIDSNITGNAPVIDYGRMLALDQVISNSEFDGDIFEPWENVDDKSPFFLADGLDWINVGGRIGITLGTSVSTNGSQYLQAPYNFYKGIQYRVVVEFEVTSGATSGSFRVYLHGEEGDTGNPDDQLVDTLSISGINTYTFDVTFTSTRVFNKIAIRAFQNVGGAFKDIELTRISIDPVNVINITPPYYLPTLPYIDTVVAIVEEAGYTLDYDINLPDEYAIAFGKKEYKYGARFIDRHLFRAFATGTQSLNVNSGTAQNIQFTNIDYSGSAGWYNNVDTWEPPNVNDYSLRARLFCRVTINVTITSGTEDYIIFLGNFPLEADSFIFNANGTYTVYLKLTSTVFGDSSDDYKIQVRRLTGVSGSATVNVTEGYFYSEVDPTPISKIHASNIVLPDMLQSDFFADFLYRFGALVNEDSGMLNVKSLQSVMQDRISAPDWTAKRDITRGEPISFFYNDYAQNNRFTDSPDTREDAVGILEIDNENVGEEKTIYSSPFVAIEQVNVGGIKICRVPMFSFESDDPFKVSDDFEVGPRLVFNRDDDNKDPEVKYNGVTKTIYKLSVYGDPISTDKATWQYFIDTYYPEVKKSLDTVKVITRYYFLTAIDIHELDLMRMIYDDGDYYLILRVVDYVGGKSTRVELLKVNT